MQITDRTDYAFRVLVHCAMAGDGLTTTAAIAASHGISTNHLVKVVGELGRLGYLRTVRGKGGGIALARPAADINLGEVVRGMENLMVVDCFGAGAGCRLVSACRLRGILADAVQAFVATLSRHTLEDLVASRADMARLLGMEVRAAN